MSVLAVHYGVDACERGRHFMTCDPLTRVWTCKFCSYAFINRPSEAA